MPDMKRFKEVPDSLVAKRNALKVADLAFQMARAEARKEELKYELTVLDQQLEDLEAKKEEILNPKKQSEDS
jgi:hypothetical protein